MPAPIPITPTNHLKSIDDKLTLILAALNTLINNGSPGLVTVPYDQIVTSYTGTQLTQAVYKEAGVTVATVTMTYVGTQLTDTVRVP